MLTIYTFIFIILLVIVAIIQNEENKSLKKQIQDLHDQVNCNKILTCMKQTEYEIRLKMLERE